MYYYLTALLLILARVSVDSDLVKLRGSLRTSWHCLAGVALLHGICTFPLSGYAMSTLDYLQTQIWLEGISWFLLWASTLALLNALLPFESPLPAVALEDEPATKG